MYLTVLLVLFVLFPSYTWTETQVEMQNLNKALRKELFQNRGYDRMARPVDHPKHPIEVSVQMRLHYIKYLDMETRVLESGAVIFITWTDPFLTWKPEEFFGIELIEVDMNEVYRPDITLTNSVDGVNLIRTSSHTQLKLNSSGVLNWLPVVAMKTQCIVDLTEWPFDQQMCIYVFASWYNFVSEVNLTLPDDEIQLGLFESNLEWKIIDTGAKIQYTPVRDELFPEIVFEITIVRTYTLYRYTIFWPVIVALAINLVALLLEIRDNVRFYAQFGSLILLVVMILYLGFKLGFGSISTPKIIIYLGQMIILVAFTIIWFVIGRILINSSLKVPARITQTFRPAQKLMGTMFINTKDIESVQLAANGGIENGNESGESKTTKETQDSSSNDKLMIIYIIDRVLFLVSLLLMIVLHN